MLVWVFLFCFLKDLTEIGVNYGEVDELISPVGPATGVQLAPHHRLLPGTGKR